MSSTSDDISISNELIPAMESLQMDQRKSPVSNICSNDESYNYSVEVPDPIPYHITSDELPIFSIRSLSPTSRSLSPVMADQMCISPVDCIESDEDNSDLDSDNNLTMGNHERMLLHDIHALIGTESNEPNERRLNLETIFEDVFLETPPKRKQNTDLRQCERQRLSLDSISRYVRDQQQYCNGNYKHLKIDENPENDL